MDRVRQAPARRPSPYADHVPSSTARSGPRRLARRALGALLTVLVTGVPAVAAAAADGGARASVVVIGTAGLHWSDLDPVATPALWSLAQGSAVGSLVTRSVRTASCPADGWLALGAGNRAADADQPEGCRELTDPAADGAVLGWDELLAERDAAAYGSRLGLLDEVLAAHGRTSLAVGPGAAIALASPDGVVERYAPLPAAPDELSTLVAGVLGDTDLVIVDAGTVPSTTPADDVTDSSTTPADDGASARRAHRAAGIEARVAAILAALDPSVPVVLASVADAGPEARLQVLAVRGTPGVAPEASGQVLRSGATRQDGYVLATDLLPTLLAALDLNDAAPAGALVGSPAQGVPSRAAGTARVAAMVDLDRHATAIRDAGPGLIVGLIAVNLALGAAVGLRAVRGGRPTRATLRAWRLGGVVVGVLPVATFLANLAPWWRAGAPGLWLATAAATALVAGLALLGPWRRFPLGPLTVVAAVTATVIVADVATGSRLLLGAPLGVHPLVAGRFYGINNSAFALLLASSLLLAAVGAGWLLARGRRGLAVGLVAAVGLVVTFVDGAPSLGADFGGPPALVPAFAVLALLVAGVRVGVRRLAVVVAAGAVVVSGFAIADWLRPESSRTHLGRFVQSVLDGGLGDVVGRKLEQNFAILAIGWPVLLVLVAVGLLMWWARRSRSVADRSADRQVMGAFTAEHPTLAHLVPAGATGLVIALVLNDSGVAIPAIALAFALPLLVATFAAWLAARSGPVRSDSA